MSNMVDLTEIRDGDRELLEAMGKIEVLPDDDAGTNKAGDGTEAAGVTESQGADAGDEASGTGTVDGAAAGTKADDGTTKSLEEMLNDATSELKNQLRDMDRKFTALERKYDRSQKLLQDANIISEDAIQQEKAENEAARSRGEYLDELLEVMSVNPKYEDVHEVVSQEHFDDMIDFMAKAIVANDKTVTVEEAKAGLTNEIWAMKNPYKYMYEITKQFHPKYAKVADSKPEDKARGPAKPGEKPDAAGKPASEVVKDVASSLQDVGGAGSVTDAVWTAAKIDALPDEETHKVPAHIWDAYMRGTLK